MHMSMYPHIHIYISEYLYHQQAIFRHAFDINPPVPIKRNDTHNPFVQRDFLIEITCTTK